MTVSELNANSLFNWLEEFGQDFGWVRTFDLTDMQSAANAGQVGIICAQRKELNSPAHLAPWFLRRPTIRLNEAGQR